MSDYTASYPRSKTKPKVRTAIKINITKKYYSRDKLCCKLVWPKLSVTLVFVLKYVTDIRQFW